MTFSLDEDVMNKFKELCEKEAYNMSGLIEKFMKEFVLEKKREEK